MGRRVCPIQVGYYLSDVNLAKDEWFRDLVERANAETGGWLPLGPVMLCARYG